MAHSQTCVGVLTKDGYPLLPTISTNVTSDIRFYLHKLVVNFGKMKTLALGNFAILQVSLSSSEMLKIKSDKKRTHVVEKEKRCSNNFLCVQQRTTSNDEVLQLTTNVRAISKTRLITSTATTQLTNDKVRGRRCREEYSRCHEREDESLSNVSYNSLQ